MGLFYCCLFLYFCYVITKILDNGNTLRIVNESNDADELEIYDLEKTSGIKVKYLEQFDHIQLYDDARRIFFTITHKEIVEPTTVNTLALYEKIVSYLNTNITVNINGETGESGDIVLNINRTEQLLGEILREQKVTNKYLKKIYNPE